MGRLIDCSDVYNAIQITTDNFGVAKRVVETNMLTMLSKIKTVKAIPKDQYENRLKADMVAMLTEIQLEIEELNTYDIERTHGLIEDSYVTTDVRNIIRQKIDRLKEKIDDN